MQTKEKYDRFLATILCTDIIDSQSLLIAEGEEQWAQAIDKFSSLSEELIQHYKGVIVEKIGDGSVATFDASDKAIYCGLDLREQIKAYNIPIKITVHNGECIKLRDGIGGLAVHITKQIHKNASSQGILISQDVKQLIHDSDFEVEFLKEIVISGVNQAIRLYIVSVNLPELNAQIPSSEKVVLQQKTHNNPFLEQVLQCIKKHIKDPDFGIETLCNELVISERQLQRKLKSLVNKSPTQLIRSVRLQHARDLISINRMSISDSAFEAGFNSPSYFSKCFKSEFGQSPSEIISNRS